MQDGGRDRSIESDMQFVYVHFYVRYISRIIPHVVVCLSIISEQTVG